MRFFGISTFLRIEKIRVHDCKFNYLHVVILVNSQIPSNLNQGSSLRFLVDGNGTNICSLCGSSMKRLLNVNGKPVFF